MRRPIQAVALLLASIASVTISACRPKGEDERTPAAVVNVRTIVVTPRSFTETLDALGSVVTRAGHVATLSAPAAGKVSRVLVTTGQAVRQGQTLIELDQEPFQVTLQAAEAAFAAATKASERQQRLATEGLVPRKDAEAAAADAAAKRADVETARRAARLATLHSPMAGVITRMTATIGASVDPMQPLVEVSDPQALDVVLGMTPADAGRVRPGAMVQVRAASNDPTATGTPLGAGTVVDVGGTIDSVSRTVAIRVRLPASRRPLTIGETVRASIAVRTRPNAIVVPADALVPAGEGFRVFVVDANGIAHERAVTVGTRGETGVEITDGLSAGERIVTAGAYGVADSARVETLTPAKP